MGGILLGRRYWKQQIDRDDSVLPSKTHVQTFTIVFKRRIDGMLYLQM
jgi:hypothetical protein